MSCRVIDNNAYELSVTPSRKRKRESGGGGQLELPERTDETPPITSTTCFTNAAFSSTPKKLLAKRLLNRENLNPFLANPCLEVKSILDIVQEQQQQQQQQLQKKQQTQLQLDTDAVKVESPKAASKPENPYEVVRKPPKKKKKHIDIEEACFENPALNLELPEKQFNPFEVQRETVTLKQPLNATKCFTNEALNIRGQDKPAARNPFEIHRCSAVSRNAANPDGVENLALESLAQPSNLQICLPFTPTLGCRIDFKNMPLSQLTPSKLLAEKLVFSPVLMVNKKTPKRSLTSISEETMDIGKELDLYQLELENSINEAKLRKSAGGNCAGVVSNDVGGCGLMLVEQQLEQRITFTHKLTEIAEQEEELQESQFQEDLTEGKANEIALNELEQKEEVKEVEELEIEKESLPLLSAMSETAEDEPPNEINTPVSVEPDVRYASDDDDDDDDDKDVTAETIDDEDEIDFKAPAPFVRAYRRAEPPPKLTVSKESLNSNKSDTKADTSEPKKHNVKNMIRNSIRKLMHPHANDKEKHTHANDKEKQPLANDNEKLTTAAEATEKPATHGASIMSSIRHSFRRRQHKPLVEDDEDLCKQKTAEISIIDSSERTMKLKSNQMQTDYVKIEDLTNEKKPSIRSSLRKSTREVRQQFMKTVFHKNQELYDFKK